MFFEIPKFSKNKISLYLGRKALVFRLYRGGYVVVCLYIKEREATLWTERGG